MKFSTVLLVAGAAIVAAQDLSALPECAKACATELLTSSNCGIDPKCICSNESFITDISGCVAKGCTTQEDLDATIKFATDICKAVDVDIPTDLPTTTPSTPATSTSVELSTGVPSTTPTGTPKNETNPNVPEPTDGGEADSAGMPVRSSLIGVVGALAAAVMLL